MCHFDLATTIQDPGTFVSSDYNTVSDTSVDGKGEVPASIPLAQLVQGSLQTPINYFNEATTIWQDSQALQPFHTFTGSCTAFHPSWDPSFKQMSINEVAEKFGLPSCCSCGFYSLLFAIKPSSLLNWQLTQCSSPFQYWVCENSSLV